MPSAEVFAMRAWSGIEMLLAAKECGRSDIHQHRVRDVYDVISTTDRYFLPARAVAFADSYAVEHGLRPPFGTR